MGSEDSSSVRRMDDTIRACAEGTLDAYRRTTAGGEIITFCWALYQHGDRWSLMPGAHYGMGGYVLRELREQLDWWMRLR